MELYTRQTSAFPLSIGTSLALESVFPGRQPAYDTARKIPQVVSLSQYDECWINLETLLRNIEGSVKRPRFMECTPQHVAEILNTEIEIIESLFQVEGAGVCQPVFYVSSFKSLRARRAGKVLFRESATTIQKEYDLKVDKVLKLLNKQTDKIRMLDSDLRSPQKTSALILSHYPYDLTSYEYFRKLDLLESHTGILKERPRWNSKYAPVGKESLEHLPFLEHLLLIFGDRHLIEPQSFKTRTRVLEISVKDKWTPYTRLDKIKTAYREHITHPADLDFISTF